MRQLLGIERITSNYIIYQPCNLVVKILCTVCKLFTKGSDHILPGHMSDMDDISISVEHRNRFEEFINKGHRGCTDAVSNAFVTLPPVLQSFQQAIRVGKTTDGIEVIYTYHQFETFVLRHDKRKVDQLILIPSDILPIEIYGKGAFGIKGHSWRCTAEILLYIFHNL